MALTRQKIKSLLIDPEEPKLSTVLKIMKIFGIFSVLSLTFFILSMFLGFQASDQFLILGISLGIICTFGFLGYFEAKDDLIGVIKMMIGISAIFTASLFVILHFHGLIESSVKDAFWLCSGMNMAFIASMIIFLGVVIWQNWIKEILSSKKSRRQRDFFDDLLDKHDGKLFQDVIEMDLDRDDRWVWEQMEQIRKEIVFSYPSEKQMLERTKYKGVRTGDFIARSDINHFFKFLGGDHRDIKNWLDCGAIVEKRV